MSTWPFKDDVVLFVQRRSGLWYTFAVPCQTVQSLGVLPEAEGGNATSVAALMNNKVWEEWPGAERHHREVIANGAGMGLAVQCYRRVQTVYLPPAA